MLKFSIIGLLVFASLVISHEPEISETFLRMPNGDEREIVSIDLRKKDGSEDIKLMAQVRFHLDLNQIKVNGHPIRHNVVTQLRMRVTIVEIENGIRKDPRLAPVIFRVLVLENHRADGSKQVIVEEEFIKVEEDEVMQVDIKQIVWDGVKRMPTASIAYKDSWIRAKSINDDHHLLVPDRQFRPRLPNEHGYMDMNFHHHHHHHGHWRIMCWFRRLSMFGKIAVVCAGVVTLISLFLSLVICFKRHCHTHHKTLVMVPMDNSVVVDGCDDVEKDTSKLPTTDPSAGDFHMELNDCYIDVSDKKKLVE